MTNMGELVAKAMANWERRPADHYPTPVDVTEAVIPVLEVLGIERVWEPACGDGRMARVLEHHGYDVTASDLRPYPGYGIPDFDFLTMDPNEAWGWDASRDVQCVMTNPPFKFAAQFIKRALEYSPNVLMLLKGTYWHAANRYKLFEEHRPAIWMPLTWRPAFLEAERGSSPMMEVGWCLWTDKETGYGLDNNACIMQPINRRVYQGYADIGVLSAMQVLEGELAETASACRSLARAAATSTP